MIICPKCNSMAEFNSYHQRYQCLSKECDYYLKPSDMIDEDKIYFNKQEGYERWELDEYIKNYSFNNSGFIDVEWYDGVKSNFDVRYLILELLKLHAKEIKIVTK